MQIDFNKTGFENFLALINAATGKNFDPRWLVFSPPSPWANTKYPAQNTSVTATAKPNGPYKGKTSFIYTRLALNLASPPLEVVYSENVSFLQFKQIVIQAAGLLYSEVDLDVTSLPVPTAEEPTKIKLVAKPGSYVYIGSLEITLTSGVPSNARLMEDGSLRLMEDGSIRVLES